MLSCLVIAERDLCDNALTLCHRGINAIGNRLTRESRLITETDPIDWHQVGHGEVNLKTTVEKILTKLVSEK